jgi:hypothetical protein
VDGSPVPSLRGDAVKDCPRPPFGIDPRQQNTEFGCNTGSGLVLQAAIAQHPFEKDLTSNQAGPRDAGAQTVTETVLQRCFPVRPEPVIDPQIGHEQRALSCITLIFDGVELDFELACIG